MQNINGKKWITDDIEELFEAILKLRNTDECARFLRDLLTIQEIETFAARWKVAQMLEQKIPYAEIEKQTGMSSATIARVNLWLERGMDGYKLMLSRMKGRRAPKATKPVVRREAKEQPLQKASKKLEKRAQKRYKETSKKTKVEKEPVIYKTKVIE